MDKSLASVMALCTVTACSANSLPPNAALPQPQTSGGDLPGTQPAMNGNAPASSANGPNHGAPRCPPGPYASSPLPANLTLTRMDTPAADWSEGPVWVASGEYLLYSAWLFSESDAQGPKTTVYKITWPSTVSSFAAAGVLRSNGLALGPQGDLYAATHDVRAIARLPAMALAQRMNLITAYDATAFNSPNDLSVSQDGTVYFVDPNYEQAGRPGQAATRVYRLTPGGMVSVVDDSRNQPNGIALSLDQNALLVGGADGVIKRYAIAADGSTGPGQLWASPGGNIDGMGIDCAGNIYATLSTQQIAIYAPGGTLIGSIPTVETASNVAFGGPDQQTLFITGNGKIYTLHMPIPGLPN